MPRVPAVLFGDSCLVDSHCDAEGALCQRGECVCRDLTARPTSDKTVCVKTHLKSLGESCSTPTDCKGRQAMSRVRRVVGRGGVVVRTSDSQSREPGCESSCCRFESWAISFRKRVSVIASWLNASQRSRVGVGTKSSARG